MNWIRRPIGSSARLRSGREVFTRVFWSINMCIRGLCYHSTLSPPRKWLSYGFLMMLCISHKTAITNALFRLKLRLGNHLNLAITERVCQLLCGDYCKNISMRIQDFIIQKTQKSSSQKLTQERLMTHCEQILYSYSLLTLLQMIDGSILWNKDIILPVRY